MLDRCASTVFTLMSRAAATSLLLRPSASNLRTSSSLGVTLPGVGSGALVFAKWPMISLVTRRRQKGLVPLDGLNCPHQVTGGV
jgi:hypothetical protein